MARVVVPNYPHHILHRGIKGFPVFAKAEYCRAYIDSLVHCKQEVGVKVYAYCLLPDHLRMIVDPCDEPARLGQFMKCVAGRHSQLVNGLYARRGRGWEGRYRSTPIQSERYLLACMRYVEYSPVRCKLVTSPEQYPWSSLRERRPGARRRVLDEEDHFLAAASDPADRYARYAQWPATPASETESHFFGWSVRSGTPCGSPAFISAIEERFGVKFPRKMYLRCHPKKSGVLL
jgi:putative transposase